jgi:hypothetical protein
MMMGVAEADAPAKELAEPARAVSPPVQECEPAVSPENSGNGCTICGELRPCRNCDSCDRAVCQPCMISSDILPGSYFCSAGCRNEAELAAEQGASGRIWRYASHNPRAESTTETRRKAFGIKTKSNTNPKTEKKPESTDKSNRVIS